MKISKKNGLIAAIIATIFFSYSSNSNSSYRGGITVTETTSETLHPRGLRETKVSKEYSFSFLGDSSNDVVVEKESFTKKK